MNASKSVYRSIRRKFMFEMTLSMASTVFVVAIPSPAWPALNIILQEAPNAATLHPVYDPGLDELGDIMEAAAQYWESIIKDNHTVTVTYGYLNLGPGVHGLAEVTADNGLRNNRERGLRY